MFTPGAMDEIMAASEGGRTGNRQEAASALMILWDAAGDDALKRVRIAHHLADLHDDPHKELLWDRRALAAVAGLTDRHAQDFHESLLVSGISSLQVKLAA